jgi:DNA-binding transcriptional MerR regulator
MIKIGDFARLSQISIVTLRHYDEMGLLRPALVDRFTGYRYYAISQLPQLNRILALKDLGFSLEQIRHVLADGLTAAQLRGMLILKRAEVEQRLAAEQERLVRIEVRLRQIELEDSMPNYEVVLKTVPSMLVASRRVMIPTNDQVPMILRSAFSEVSNYVKQQGGKEMGPCLAVWHTPADVYTDEDTEAVVPIDRLLHSTDRVQVYELPQVEVASLVHAGNFDDFTQGHTVLLQWIDAHDYHIAGPFREIYIKHDHGDLTDSSTEIQFPVEKA